MEQPQELKQPSPWKELLRDLLTILVIAGVIILVMQAVIQKFVVDGESMDYTLQNGQQLMVSKITYNFSKPDRGDIIVFHPPNQIDSDDYIKRIIGLPGETIVIRDGNVSIYLEDGSILELDEPYVTNHSARSIPATKIPEGKYFVMGDNRANSSDSRNGWMLEEDNIIGKGWLTVWPPSKWGLIPNHAFDKD